MLTVKATNRFLRDVKLATKRGNDLDMLETVVDLLQARKPLPVKTEIIIFLGIGTSIGNAISNQIGS